MRRLLPALALSVLWLRREATAEEVTLDGIRLLNDCAKYIALADADPFPVSPGGECYGFVGGMIGAHIQEASRSEGPGAPPAAFCVPDGTTLDQAIHVFHAYLISHRGDLRESGAALAYAAFVEAWPCATKAALPSANGKSGPLCPMCDLSTPSARLARQVKLVDSPKDVADCRLLGTVTGWEDSEKKNGGFQLATKAGAYSGGKAADVRVLHVDGADDRAYLCGAAK
ncbi:MAG TPA: Rap1a/Tai family immunity protein [Thermoanaerobaculia bacterium]|nr:Rap1a/Tai family immunity protein [Thermoanaerobaculia bacterium]